MSDEILTPKILSTNPDQEPKGERSQPTRKKMDNAPVYPAGLFGGAYGPFGPFGYGGGYGGGGVCAGRSRIDDEAAVRVFDLPKTSDMQSAVSRAEERIADLQREQAAMSRDIAGIGRDLQLQASTEANETRRELAKCCCDTQVKILETKSDLDKSICQQTERLSAEGVRNTQAILDKVTSINEQNLNQALNRANTRGDLLEQTNAIIQACGCCGDGGGHHHGRGGSYSGWSPPGQDK